MTSIDYVEDFDAGGGLHSIFDASAQPDAEVTSEIMLDDAPSFPEAPGDVTDPQVPEDTQAAETTAPPAAAQEPAPEPAQEPAAEPALTEDGVYGSAFQWHSDWLFQVEDGYCGPTSVAIIVNEYFGAGIVDPQVMVDKAYELGLTEDISNGMYMADVQTLLEASGIPCENVTSSMDDLAARLEAGYGVIAFVDSGEVWGTEDSDGAAGPEDDASDHFLVVTEIDMTTGMVTVEDPGNLEGSGTHIPISQFEDAWADSNFEMVSTTSPDPDLADAAGGAVGPQFAIANVTRRDVIQ